MKYYNLPDIEARYFAGNSDTPKTLVVGIKQPVNSDCGGFVHEWKQRMLAKYPIGTIIGLKHNRKVVGAYEVTGARVCRVQEVTPEEWVGCGFLWDAIFYSTEGRKAAMVKVQEAYNTKHARRVHPLTWADNPWVMPIQMRGAG